MKWVSHVLNWKADKDLIKTDQLYSISFNLFMCSGKVLFSVKGNLGNYTFNLYLNNNQ